MKQKPAQLFADVETVKISKADLQDKSKDGWPGQMIGFIYVRPT